MHYISFSVLLDAYLFHLSTFTDSQCKIQVRRSASDIIHDQRLSTNANDDASLFVLTRLFDIVYKRRLIIGQQEMLEHICVMIDFEIRLVYV